MQGKIENGAPNSQINSVDYTNHTVDFVNHSADYTNRSADLRILCTVVIGDLK